MAMKVFLMAAFIKEIILMANLKGLVAILGQTDNFMRDNGQMD